MAPNAFRFSGATISEDRAEVIVDGTSETGADVDAIEVSVIAVANPGKRLQGSAANLQSPWYIRLPQADLPDGIEPFTEDEQVFIVGEAITDGTLILWGGLDQTGVVHVSSSAMEQNATS
jgi:hypothetical protein